MANTNLINTDAKTGGPVLQGVPLHEEYGVYYHRWQFLERSYSGGAQYRLGNYLTKYVMENNNEYLQRVARTPLDNHCRSIIHIFNSFLFRNQPKRDFGNMVNMPEIDQFLKDADLEGRSFDAFMRDANINASIYGHCLILLDKPSVNLGTRAEELEQGIRPYASLFTPQNILDWEFKRLPSGHYELSFLRLFEREQRAFGLETQYYIRTFTKEKIYLEKYTPAEKKPTQIVEEIDNPLGVIPAVFVYAQRSPVRGIGVSDIGDIADMQNSIYNELSEIEQTIRLSGHPTLVKSIDTEASAGAGAIINMSNDLDPGLRPSLLQPSGQSIDMILNSIENKVKMIDRMAHMGSVRAIETRSMSGIALQTEMLQLDTKLIEKSHSLELAEEQLWRLMGKWLGMSWDGEVKYPSVFNIRDRNYEMDLLKKAADTNPADPTVKQMIDKKIVETLLHDKDEYDQYAKEMEHPVTTTADRSAHIQQMIMDGYTDQQILKIHPEISPADIDAAKQQLLNTNNDTAPTTQTPIS
jgi:hypothetical protein